MISRARSKWGTALGMGLAIVVMGCGGSETGSGDAGTGGAGGASASGGRSGNSTGGATASGGRSGNSTGGATASGGRSGNSTGGAAASGGRSGNSTGGATASGGRSGTGGRGVADGGIPDAIPGLDGFSLDGLLADAGIPACRANVTDGSACVSGTDTGCQPASGGGTLCICQSATWRCF